MDTQTINVLNVIIEIVIALLVILAIAGIPTGIALLASSFSQKLDKTKTKFRVWGIVAIVLPIILLFVLLSLWGLVRIMTNTVGG